MFRFIPSSIDVFAAKSPDEGQVATVWDGLGWDGMGWDGMEWDGIALPLAHCDEVCTVTDTFSTDDPPLWSGLLSTAPRTAAATKQVDPEPALARAAATGQAGNTGRVSHTTPNTLVTIRKTRIPDFFTAGV